MTRRSKKKSLLEKARDNLESGRILASLSYSLTVVARSPSEIKIELGRRLGKGRTNASEEDWQLQILRWSKVHGRSFEREK